TPDGGVAAAGVPRVRSDPAADGVGSGGACHPAECGASPHLAAVTLPDAGPIVGPSVIPHAAKNEVGLNVWKLWVIKDRSFSWCSVGIFARQPSMAARNSRNVA